MDQKSQNDVSSKAPFVAAGHLELQALGRPVQLGTLYDRNTDQFVHGPTLWSQLDLDNNVREQACPSTNVDFILSDLLEAKTSKLEICGNLKLSIMLGMVGVSGSAGYLTDNVKTAIAERVTLRYSETTKFKELKLADLTKAQRYNEESQQDIATHVVTGITYGADFNLTFERNLEIKSKHGTMQARSAKNGTKQAREGAKTSLFDLVKQIPTLALDNYNVDGGGSLFRKNKDAQVTESIHCTFYGDFSPERNPTSYSEAIDVYQGLSNTLRDHTEKAVPIKIYIYPLDQIPALGQRKVNIDISELLIGEATHCFEELQELKQESDTLRPNYI